MFPGHGAVLEQMDKGRKQLIEVEKRAATTGSGRTEDVSARLRSLEAEEKAIDSKAMMMNKATQLQDAMLKGGDMAGALVEKTLNAPGIGAPNIASGKSPSGGGIDLGMHLEPRLGLGDGSGGRKPESDKRENGPETDTGLNDDVRLTDKAGDDLWPKRDAELDAYGADETDREERDDRLGATSLAVTRQGVWPYYQSIGSVTHA
jgi:hypothetical protein